MKILLDFYRKVLKLNVKDLQEKYRRKTPLTSETPLAWRVRIVLSMVSKDCPCCGTEKMFPCGGDLDDNLIICTGRLLTNKEVAQLLNPETKNQTTK